jgi:hypothetical protein
VALADKGRSGEIAQIESFHLRRRNARIFKRFLARIHGERPYVAVRERAKRCLPCPNYCYGSHTTIRIALRPKDRLHVFAKRSSVVFKADENCDPIAAGWEHE